MSAKRKPTKPAQALPSDDALWVAAWRAQEEARERRKQTLTLAAAEAALARAPSTEREFVVRAGAAFMSLWRGFEERWVTAQCHITEHQGGYSLNGPARDRLNGLAAELLAEIRGACRDGSVRLDEELRTRDLRAAEKPAG